MGIVLTAWAWLTGLKAVGARWLTRETAGAIAVAVVAVVLLVAGVLLWHGIRSGAVEANDASWRGRIASSRLIVALQARARDKRAADAATVERERYVAQLRDVAEHAADLEREIARLRAEAAGDPVIYPRSLVKELRK